ncbi:MAG TPA: hypothetical protein VH116_07040 [Gemmatimonadales bacterium]|nr:hypothetical protein [Gemmatimonadales bacterium]
MTLGVGVIVSFGTTPTLYVASPSGGVDAVAVTTDSVLWHNDEASVPLLARGDRVLALAYPSSEHHTSRLAFLDADSGKVVAELPTLEVPGWGPLNYVGEGNKAWFALEGISQNGHDFLRWRHRARDVRGYTPPNPPRPVSGPEPEDTGTVEAILARATLSPTTEHLASQHLQTARDAKGGYRWGPFETGGVRVTLAKLVHQKAITLLMRRTRGGKALADVVIARPPWNSCDLGSSVDRRYVLGVYQIPGRRDPFLYDVTVYAAASGKRVGHIATDAYPATFVVWHHQLLSYFPNHVTLVELESGKKRLDRPVRYLGSYETPPAGARPR